MTWEEGWRLTGMRRWKQLYSLPTELKNSTLKEHSRGQLRVLLFMTIELTKSQISNQTDHHYLHLATKADSRNNPGTNHRTTTHKDLRFEISKIYDI